MVEAKYFYVYHASSYESYGWGIRENDGDFFRMVTNGTHVECEFVFGALVEVKHAAVLEVLLDNMEDHREMIETIKLFSEFI